MARGRFPLGRRARRPALALGSSALVSARRGSHSVDYADILREACGMSVTQASTITKHSARKTLVSAAQAAGCPWEQCIELGHWAETALDSSFLFPQEDMCRKKALECLSMPKRYSADARLRRVARIVGNQIQLLAAYLRARPPVAAAQTFQTMWELMSQYNRSSEGS